MAKRRRERMSEAKKNIIAELIQEYDIKTAADIQEALKDLLGGTIQEMLEAELDEHLGYEEYDRSDNPDYRNGVKHKKLRSTYGEIPIDVPQDRDGDFEPKIVPKRKKDISEIEQKIIAMSAKGMTTRQISDIVEDLYNPILNIACHANLNNNEIYPLLSLMNTIHTGKTSISHSQLIQSHELSENESLKEKFKKSESNIIIADASNQYAMRNLNNLIDLYYSSKETSTKKGDKNLVLGLLMITKNPFLDKHVLNVTCNNIDQNRLMEIKRMHTDLYDLTAHFCQRVKKKEKKRLKIKLDNPGALTKENIKELSDEIDQNSIFDSSKCQALAPIILTLNNFFKFLNKKNYISADTCKFYLQIVRSIYIPESATMNDTVTSDDLPENIVVKCLYGLINKSKSLISTSIDKTPFIYTQSTKYGNMICFNHIEDVITFIKNNIELLDEKLYSKFYDIVLMENSSSGAQLLKRRLKEKNLIITNAGRPDYRIKNKTYLALDIDKIALLIQDVKM